MAKRGNIGIEYNIPKGSKLSTIPVDPEAIKRLFPKNEKTYHDYLIEFLGSKKIFDEKMSQLNKKMEAAYPKGIKENCIYCNGESENKDDKNCAKYTAQMQSSMFWAGMAFVNSVIRNKHILKDFDSRKKLAEKFFDCLHFINGRGVMYLDLDELSRYTIQAGFISLSKMLASAPHLKSLAYINNSLDEIDQTQIDNELFEKEDYNYLDLQKKFFESKQRFIKEKLALNENEKGQQKTIGKEKNKPTIVHYALYYHYLQVTGIFQYFENHPNGKVTAIQEMIQEENIETTPKYFQKVYNKITNHPSNRVANNQKANIEYVANTMLTDYPKAQKIALEELKQAQTKSR